MATAYSHQRTFIIEVMGRNCGYLALVAGIASEADYVFIPEVPPQKDWPQHLCDKLTLGREKAGQRANIILVSEGALDREGKQITCEMVKKVSTIIKQLAICQNMLFIHSIIFVCHFHLLLLFITIGHC